MAGRTIGNGYSVDMNKLQRLLKGEFPTSDDPITPRPDIEVEITDNNTAIVRSVNHMAGWRVTELVQAKRPGNWLLAVDWWIMVDGEKVEQANPHRNNDGDWVWLLKRV